MKKYLVLTILGLVIGFSGCGNSTASPSKVDMKASFVDSKWNGDKVPSKEVCSDYNMEAGSTPAIAVTNLPKGTNKVVLSFSDETFTKMSNGGHGVISYRVEDGATSVAIPSIQGETFDLPANFKSEKAHTGTRFGKTPGAYLAPCSGGKGNTYSVLIEAVKESGQESITLSKINLKLGTY